MTDADNKVAGTPSKSFFIDMITRDLTITDCILDLIDNSADHAVKRDGVDVMKILDDGAQRPKFRQSTVSLSVSKSNFKIHDTCGGISQEDAKKTIFRFGIPFGPSSTPGLSVYGIGMKRAFFKLGATITVESATDQDWFVMDIDVDKWNHKGDDDWDFEFRASGKAEDRFPSKPRAGTTQIVIKDLRDDISRRFGQISFVKELIERVASAYSLFLTAGLNIQINDERVQSKLPIVASLGTELKPARKLLRLGVCPSNRKIGKFGGRKTIAEPPIVDPGASCEVDFFRVTLLGQAPRRCGSACHCRCYSEG